MTEYQTCNFIELTACYEPVIEVPMDFIEECRLFRETHERIYAEKQKAIPVFYGIEPDGTAYFYHGNTRIRVTEHFNDSGRSFSALVEDVVQYATGTH